MSSKNNIEDFLKDKFTELDNAPMNDWGAFEKKLNRALWFSRARSMAAFSLFILALVAGFNSIQNIGETKALGVQEENYQLEELKAKPTENTQDVLLYRSQPEETDLKNFKKNNLSSKSKPFAGEQAAISNSTKVKHTAAKTDIKEEKVRAVAILENKQATYNAAIVAAPVKQAKAVVLTDVSDINTENTITDEVEQIEVSNEKPVVNNIPVLQQKDFTPVVEMQSASEIFMFTEQGELIPRRNMLDLDFARNGAFLLGGPRSLMAPIPVNGYSTKRKRYISHLQAQNPWSYSINVYPNFTFRKFSVDRKKVNLLHRDFVDAIEASESRGFSFNVGLEVSRRIGDITYLNGGFEFISYNTNANFNFTNFRDANIDAATGEIKSYNIREEPIDIAFTDENNYHYLNFPLSISYQPWATSHIRLNLEAGGSFMYFLGAKGQTIDYTTLDIIDLSTREYREYSGSFSLKVGANYYVTERINFGFEPTLMYFTNTIYTEDMPFTVIPYSVGLNVHMQVKLN